MFYLLINSCMDPIDSAKEASSFDKNDSILSIDSTDPFLLATFS